MTTITRNYKHLNNCSLLDFYSVDIEERMLPEKEYHYVTGTSVLVKSEKRVYFNSRIHVNKRIELNPLFCGLLTDAMILQDRDLISNVLNKFGSVWQ